MESKIEFKGLMALPTPTTAAMWQLLVIVVVVHPLCVVGGWLMLWHAGPLYIIIIIFSASRFGFLSLPRSPYYCWSDRTVSGGNGVGM